MVISDPRALSQLPPVIQDLHGGMPPELAAAPMRLMLIAAVVGWGTGIKVPHDSCSVLLMVQWAMGAS